MTHPGILPLPKSIYDIYNFEHDVLIGPCACGAWHQSPKDYLDKMSEFSVHLVNPPCDSDACAHCVARRFLAKNDRGIQ